MAYTTNPVINGGSFFSSVIISTPPPPIVPPVTGNQIATIVVQPKPSTTPSNGSYQVSATIAPLRGQVPAGTTLTTMDGTGQCVVINTHTDGSASLLIATALVSYSGTTVSIPLVTTSTSPEPALTVSAIIAANPTAQVDLKSYGVCTLNVNSPTRINWANSRYICAQYHVRAPNAGTTTLEAVYTVHHWPAWGSAPARTHVEVAVENGSMTIPDFGSGSITGITTPATYTDATVTVGGSVVGTASSSGAAEGSHTFSRAWYASGWTGAGDTGLFAAQLHTQLQEHPLFFKIVRPQHPNTPSVRWASSIYTPWSPVDLRVVDMGSSGGYPGIGPLPEWDAAFLQGGHPLCARAVEANALAVLGWNLTVRDEATKLPPTPQKLQGWDRYRGWPNQSNGSNRQTWVVSHHPAAGLMAFICRPSPIFLDIARFVATINTTDIDHGGQNLNYYTPTYTDLADDYGVFGHWRQTRGQAWGMRSLAHAIFLSTGSYRTGYENWLNKNRIYADKFRLQAAGNSRLLWRGGPLTITANPDGENGSDNATWLAGQQLAPWQNGYWLAVTSAIANAKLLSDPAQQTAFETLVDWHLQWPTEWVNEQQASGAWRYFPQFVTVGGDPAAPTTNPPNWANVIYPTNWPARRAFRNMTDTPPTRAGGLFVNDSDPPQFADYTGSGTVATTYWETYWWGALVCAVERGVPGAAAAWATVNADFTGITAWLDGAGAVGANPQWAWYPRANI